MTERLQKRGYDCKCETTLHTELQQTAQAMAPLLKTEGSVPVAQYAFVDAQAHPKETDVTACRHADIS